MLTQTKKRGTINVLIEELSAGTGLTSAAECF